tara:strand:- start:1455 stop:1673 length:219 start_codon:yes stop_codon:yes gene_type:complete
MDRRNLKQRLSDPEYVKHWFDQAGGEAVVRIEELETAMTGLVEKYKEIVSDEEAGRSLQDDALVRAELALIE